MEKPEYISYKDISDILKKAHEQHRKNGINMGIPALPPEELEKWVGDEGKCFVALDGDRLVGTESFMARKLNRWYCKGKVAEMTMQGVLPEYQGMHISSMLNKSSEEAIKKLGYTAIYFDTAEANDKRIRIGEKEGFVLVDYFWTGDHYSVGMVKWLEARPYPAWYCRLRFQMKRCAVYIKRFLGLYRKKELRYPA